MILDCFHGRYLTMPIPSGLVRKNQNPIKSVSTVKLWGRHAGSLAGAAYAAGRPLCFPRLAASTTHSRNYAPAWFKYEARHGCLVGQERRAKTPVSRPVGEPPPAVRRTLGESGPSRCWP